MMWLSLRGVDTFLLNKLVILGWLVLILRPRQRFTRRFVLIPPVMLTLSCLVTITELIVSRAMNSQNSNFFELQNLLSLYQEIFSIVATVAHLHVTELLLGYWMVRNFYTRFTCAYNVKPDAEGNVPRYHSWTEERFIFTLILVLTYFLSPVGLVTYYLATKTYFYPYTTCVPIDWRQPQRFKLKKIVSAVDYQFLSTRPVRFGDSLPEHLRNLYRVVRGLVGTVTGLIVLAFYGIYVMYCLIFHRQMTDATMNYPRWPPASVRVHTTKAIWQSITTPEKDRNWLWKLNSYWLQVCTFILFGPSGDEPLSIFRAIQDDFLKILGKSSTGGFFPFGDGIGVGSHKYVKAYLESRDPVIIKDYQTVGWSVSSSLIKFCDSTHIFLPNRNHPKPDRLLLSRKIIHHWLAAFPHTLVSLTDSHSKKNTETYRYLCRIVPRHLNHEPGKDTVYLAVGETLFFLATGGSLTAREREAYLDCVKNAFTFTPDWLNFLVAGNYMENKGYASHEKFKAAFARHVHGPALQAAFEAAEGHMTKSEVLRLVTSAFCLGGAPGPAKLTASVVQRLWADQSDGISQEKMVDLFYENPRNFIKECARHNSVLPMVSLLSNENIAHDVMTHTGASLPAHTRVHCSLMDANHDPDEFTSPAEFNPRRSAIEMGKIMTWNGSESGIEKKDVESRPPRYCPGHDLSLQVMEFLASRFAPVILPRMEIPQSQAKEDSGELILLSHSITPELKVEIPHTIDGRDHPDKDESEIYIFIRELYSRKNLDAKRNNHYYSGIDGYTRFIMKLSKLALAAWNAKPPRAIDIVEPTNLPTQDIHLKRVDGVRSAAAWDEDDPSNWHLLGDLISKVLNSTIWPIVDLDLPFNSVDDMIAWRWEYFPSMPAPNNPQWYGDSDELMSRFAFFGLACHHTRKLDSTDKSMELHTATLNQTVLESAHYVNDMTALSLFAVRAPFDQYGAAAYFDVDRRLIGIYLSHRDELVTPLVNSNSVDNGWAYAKYMWRSSALALVTIRDHLLSTHFVEANTLTNVSREFLPVAHPLRIFLKPFTYRTATINYSAAKSLVNQGGLCHRIWGFEFHEFLKLCDYAIANYRFRTMPDWLHHSMKLEQNRRSDTRSTKHQCMNTDAKVETDSDTARKERPNCGFNLTDSVEPHNLENEAVENESEWVKYYPIAEDLPAYWKIVRDYVRRFFEIEYGKEDSTEKEKKDKSVLEHAFMNEPYERRFISELCKPLGLNGIPNRSFLIDVITQLICACTGIHEHVGHVADYLFDPRFIGTKIRRDLPALLPSVQNYSLMLVLTVLTAMRMPGLMEDWSHLIPRIATDIRHGKPSSTMTEEDVKSHLDNYFLFKQQLMKRIEKIEQRHQLPDTFPFHSFNPSYMECSVSV